MIPDFLCLGGQPMPHYTVIENSKLFQHLLSRAKSLFWRCHVITSISGICFGTSVSFRQQTFCTWQNDEREMAREWGPLALRPHKQHFLFVVPLASSLWSVP